MRYSTIFAVGVFCLMISSVLHAQEQATRLEDVVVTEKRLVAPTKETNETVYTGTEITREGIQIQGSRGETSVYEIGNIFMIRKTSMEFPSIKEPFRPISGPVWEPAAVPLISNPGGLKKNPGSI